MAQKQPPYVGGVGTIGVGGTVFTVTGALDDTNCIEGDHVRDPATGYESRVLERLTIQTFRVPPWRGAALAGAAYELYPDSNLRGGYQAAVTTQLLARLSAKGLVWILPPVFASPTAAKWGADEDQYVFSPSLKLWWVMQAGAWTPTGAPYGMMATNALSEISGLGLADTARQNLGLSKQTGPYDANPNLVMMTGAFGWGGNAILAADLDWATAPGIYSTSPSTVHQPSPASYYNVLVMRLGGSIISQLAMLGTAGGGNTCYMRGSNDNGVTWSSWTAITAAFGSNGNGSYIQFGNGVQICWKIGHTLSYNSATLYQSNWTFPSVFVASPLVLASVRETNNWPTQGYVACRTGGGSSCNIQFWGQGMPGGITFETNVAAIGRWL